MIYLSSEFLMLTVAGCIAQPTMESFALATLGLAWFLSAPSKRLLRRLEASELERSLTEMQTDLHSLQAGLQHLNMLLAEMVDAEEPVSEPPSESPPSVRHDNVIPFRGR